MIINSFDLQIKWASQVALVVKNPPVNAGDVRSEGSIPGLERSPGGRHGNLLEYTSWEKPMDRGARGLQQTGSKLEKEYVKAVYCHPANLTSMQSTSCKMPG